MKYKLNYSDENYRDAINFKQALYNFPVTIEIKKKLFILGCGSSDRITVKIKKGIVYVLSVNTGLDYIGLRVIDLKDNSVNEIFFDSGQISQMKPNLLELSTSYQIRFMNQWLPE